MRQNKQQTPRGAARIIAVLALLALVWSCAAPVSTTRSGPKDASRTVLIASMPSDFKKAVVQKVSEDLAASGIQVKTLPLKELENEKTENYHAILLVNRCEAWMVSRDTRKFIEEIEQKRKDDLFILTTSMNPEYTQKLPEGLDGITSASDMAKVDTLSATVVEKIKNRLGR